MNKQKLPLENITMIETSDGWHYDNNIVAVTERVFEGRAYLLITYASGERVAIRSDDVVKIRYGKKESMIKTQKDLIDAWKAGKLMEIVGELEKEE